MITRGGAERSGIVIFAKAPIAGYAKTRLIPEIGAYRAADLQASLIQKAVATALAVKSGSVSLWCSPDQHHDLFASLKAIHGVALYDQAGCDLGARMLHAFEMLTPHHTTLLIGTDCPALRSDHLSECLSSLRLDHDAVFIPAEDGGYVLVGMDRPIPELFHGISWGTGLVMSETRLRASRANLQIAEPAILWDIDDAIDYSRAISLGLI